ncbi:MAG: bifunctional DNA primase/polymerase, partial [Cyanobacteria bacterium J06641_5]
MWYAFWRLLFLDHDGESCDRLIESLSGQSLADALPKTVGITSGRPGRYQLIYRVPEKYWEAIATKRLNTGTTGDDGKAEQLEF